MGEKALKVIKNIVFDYGQVLIKYSPRDIIAHFSDRPEAAEYAEEIFASPEWWRMDAGELDGEGYIKTLHGRIPDSLIPDAAEAVRSWFRVVPPVEGMKELMHELKLRGYGLYLLSNVTRDLEGHMRELDLFRDLDGWVLSGTERTVKPGERIYRRLAEKYRLSPSECFFTDDREENVAAALRLGWSGTVFKGCDALRRTMADAGII